ncbi:efflux RND transporter periplasmic adaptor subunit [Culturomica massiliensis]|jgi:HlyD family secretion protein|uniref:efflux RND transporter periplasmic adaptor subunit n=1 Tax=Culturomica massiliensis TaxID=1841857 RepID=UPI00033F66C9|nr:MULTISPECIES: HlyD family efflux transporter periplasmic adaptor subunit [Odoribacteraceae]RHV88470.1 HlyD family efflux transporter periplasmic adaptor subunit [Odoribacter sp. OF09-27XD]CCZ07848.1 efflux transporter RND family MFP subunit [Odoribacter sp. CAG:788]
MDKVIEQKRGLKKKHIPYLIGGALALLFIGWLIFGNHSSTLRVEKDKITIEEVRKGTFNDYIRIMGNVEPIMFFQLSALEGGRVVEKIVEEGAMVKKGDIIVKLENPNLSMEILKSEADLAYQENELRNTLLSMEKEKLSIRQERLQSELTVTRNKRKYDQNKKLYEEDLIAKEDYLTAKEDYETSVENNKMLIERQKQDSIYREIQVENMQESLNNMRRNLKLVRERNDNLNVKAPISGQLGTLSVEIGQSVSSGMEIGKINVLDNYKVVAQIDEHYIDRVRKDLEASLERQGTNFNMKVLKVYPDVKGGQFKTDLCFVGEMPENVRTGQTYHINLQLGQADESVLIPRGAFYQSTGGQWIFVLSPDGSEAYRRTIKIGKQNPQYYQVIEGVEPGEKVITSGYEMYGDNERLILK